MSAVKAFFIGHGGAEAKGPFDSIEKSCGGPLISGNGCGAVHIGRTVQGTVRAGQAPGHYAVGG